MLSYHDYSSIFILAFCGIYDVVLYWFTVDWTCYIDEENTGLLPRVIDCYKLKVL